MDYDTLTSNYEFKIGTHARAPSCRARTRAAVTGVVEESVRAAVDRGSGGDNRGADWVAAHRPRPWRSLMAAGRRLGRGGAFF
jgi:hypothetical protein